MMWATRHLCSWWITVGLLAVLTVSLDAQVGAGALVGDVRDVQGMALTGATVTTVEAGTSLARIATSDDRGAWVIAGLLPGTYRLEVRLPGFAPAIRDALTVLTGETLRIDVTLAAGTQAETITVAAEAPLLREAGGLGLVVTRRAATSLPLNGRSFIGLVALAPGVALPPGSSLPRINGGRPRTNEYLFDGISVLQPEPGQVAFFPNVDAIEEFRVETNSPPAEFGRFNGGVVTLTTRSGSGTVHGSLFDFVRHEALNARNAFALPDAPARFRRQQFGGVVGGPLPGARTFFFGDYQGQRQVISRTAISTVPTQLQRSGLFTEPIAGRVPVIHDPATTTVSAGGVATRLPFPGNAIPADRIDPVALALLARYPLPTSAGTANNYQRVADEQINQDQGSLRLDVVPGRRGDRVFARVTTFAEHLVPVTPLSDGSGLATGTPGPQRTRAWAVASAWQHVVSPRVLTELRIGDTRRSVARRAAPASTDAAASSDLPPLLPDARFTDALPTFLVAGYQQLGSSPNTATDFATSVTQVAAAITRSAGRHTVKAGADLRWSRLDVVQPPSPTGLYTFSSTFTDQPGTIGTGSPLASFLLGQVQQFSIDLQQAPIRNRAHAQEYFVQDDWRPSGRVTVSAGLRYTLNFPSVERDDQAAIFDLATEQLRYLGRDGESRSARQLHALNLGPRLGITWRATDRMAVRAGYGLIWIEQAGITTPFTTPAFPFVQTASQRTLDGLAPAFVLAEGASVVPVSPTPDAGLGQGVFAVDRDLGSGYVQQWHASIQHALRPRLLVEFAYVGSAITRVGIPDANLNQLTAEQLALGSPLLQRVPNPFFGTIPRSSSLGDPTIPAAQLLKPYPRFTSVSLYRNNVGRAHYHGVTARIEQRLTQGLSWMVSYTRSRLVDDASSVFDASILTGPAANAPVADAWNRRLARDVSTGDIPHAFVSSFVWDLPFGRDRAHHAPRWLAPVVHDWTISGIVTLQSGTPVAVTQATNTNAFAGFGVQRPNLVGEPLLPDEARSAARWFETTAFAAAAQFTLGTASRNPLRGPGFRSLDLAISRRVPIGARAIELRGEVFNATNTPPLGQPNGVFGSAAFGTITTAGDPRVVQLAVRFLF